MTATSFADRYGPWALIVGGSDGLGAAFAHELAARGLNLVLVARRRAALDALATTLTSAHGVTVRVAAIDAATPSAADEISEQIAGLDVGLLVCNAAFAPIGEFLDLPESEIDAMVELNCRLAARLAHRVGPRLVRRGHGGLIFLSSMASAQGSAMVAHYAATKAYLRVLAEGLWAELRPRGVDVLATCPGRVATPTFDRTEPGSAGPIAPPVMASAQVARETLAALGRGPVIIPGRVNRIAAALMSRLMPRRTAIGMVSTATRTMYPGRPDAGEHGS